MAPQRAMETAPLPRSLLRTIRESRVAQGLVLVSDHSLSVLAHGFPFNSSMILSKSDGRQRYTSATPSVLNSSSTIF